METHLCSALVRRVRNGYVKEVFEGNCFQGTFAIADSVESGIQTLEKTLNAA
jgi:hypothetical protein